jgi:hypothetical protein
MAMSSSTSNGSFEPNDRSSARNGAERDAEHKSGTSDDASEERVAAESPDMSILTRNQVPSPPCPVHLLGDAAEWVMATAESKNAPVDFVALSMIIAAAGMIGARRRVSPWAGWEEPCILWGECIGPPSSNKSPAMDPVRDAVRTIERELNKDFDAKQREYKRQLKKAELRLVAWEREVEAALKANQEPPLMPEMPKPPIKMRIWIGDTTTEQAARMLGENPAGFICIRDELAGLFGAFDKYGGSGSDRSFWNEAYGGRSYRYDRVGLKDGPIDIHFNAISLIGGMQPDRLDTMVLSGDDDGLAARPIYAWPDPVPPHRPSCTVDATKIVAVLRRLSALKFDTADDTTVEPRVVPLEADATEEFEAWWIGKQYRAKIDASGMLAGAVGKLDGTALRLALVLEFLTWAWDQNEAHEPDCVTRKSVINSMRLIDDWVRPNLERVFAEASLPQDHKDAMIVARWLLKAKPNNINARELRRRSRFPGPKKAKELDDALEVPVDAVADAAAARSQTGRASSQGFYGQSCCLPGAVMPRALLPKLPRLPKIRTPAMTPDFGCFGFFDRLAPAEGGAA